MDAEPEDRTRAAEVGTFTVSGATSIRVLVSNVALRTMAQSCLRRCICTGVRVSKRPSVGWVVSGGGPPAAFMWGVLFLNDGGTSRTESWASDDELHSGESDSDSGSVGAVEFDAIVEADRGEADMEGIL